MIKPSGLAGYSIGAIALMALASGACSKSESKKGLPPASDWQAPVGASPGNDPNNPHAGMNNPHAGMNNPHAGMNNPHAGMNDPHAGMNMSGNPHAGMGMAGDPHAGMAMPGSSGQAAGGVDVTTLGLEAPDPNRTIDPNKSLSGTIKPNSDTRDRIRPGTVIFLSVKRADSKTGQPIGSPLAVKRLVLSSWPLWFQVTEENAMIRGTDFSGDVVIVAWTDQDHDAITKQHGDVKGQVRAKIPQKDLALVLDTVIQ